MPTLEVSCRMCERIHTPTQDDFRRGIWRVCPRCRDGPASIRRHEADPQTLSGPNNASEMSSNGRREDHRS